ncbi:S41 family peptidase [Aureibaculum sp. 2210JD6-5]|uniref:S41 family peptidase n=1 Tax=Aureibaculum sp. 2210JD6-5 TaxID=3103957 RepID=UPI002AAE18D3|nr:S41 family peptidase [Aureibaculum sp. 2210JD6-5]MDY7394747.1 S41 family peptidase [Aureibaculum sp. 2210JD6-5]
MSKNKIYYPLFLSLAVALGIFIGSMLDYPQKSAALLFNTNPQEAKIKRLINYIQYDYVDKVDTDSLLDGTIRNILGKLDPHSVYIPASEHDAIAETMNGEFVGVGIRFFMYNDSLTVTNVVKDGPSDKAGVEPGDRILIANNDTLYGKNLMSNYIIKTFKGEPNTKVKIKVYRKYKDTLLNFTLKRGTIPLESVPSYYMLTDTLGYIKIDKFANKTYDEFKTALNTLKQKNMKRLVLDLRGNPGGYLGIATQIVDEFLEDDKLIVFTKNKGGKIDKTFATSKGDFEKGQVYVLIDEVSASASEIVAGALQDNDKGVIVGRRSFGKGLVQQEMELGDGSAVRLTVSRYYTPTGRSIQKPYNTGNGQSYYNDRITRYHNGELTNFDSIKVVDSLKFVTPKGKNVYGGGGIVPDVFVSIDTTAYLGRFHFATMQDFVFEYVDNHREKMNTWTEGDFKQNFDDDGEILKEYLSLFDDESKISDIITPHLKRYLKALFARNLFDENLFYQVLNNGDEMLKRVKELEMQGNPVMSSDL